MKGILLFTGEGPPRLREVVVNNNLPPTRKTIVRVLGGAYSVDPYVKALGGTGLCLLTTNTNIYDRDNLNYSASELKNARFPDVKTPDFDAPIVEYCTGLAMIIGIDLNAEPVQRYISITKVPLPAYLSSFNTWANVFNYRWS